MGIVNIAQSINMLDNDSPYERPSPIFSGKLFALVLIGISSMYVIIMICQAYLTNKDKYDFETSRESEYDYLTESYDFKAY